MTDHGYDFNILSIQLLLLSLLTQLTCLHISRNHFFLHYHYFHLPLSLYSHYFPLLTLSLRCDLFPLFALHFITLALPTPLLNFLIFFYFPRLFFLLSFIFNLFPFPSLLSLSFPFFSRHPFSLHFLCRPHSPYATLINFVYKIIMTYQLQIPLFKDKEQKIRIPFFFSFLQIEMSLLPKRNGNARS